MSNYLNLWPLITPDVLTELVTNLGWEPKGVAHTYWAHMAWEAPNGQRTFIPTAKRGDWIEMSNGAITQIACGEGLTVNDILDVLCGMVGLEAPNNP